MERQQRLTGGGRQTRNRCGSKPAVGSDYSITGATKSFCLELDEFHLLIVNLLAATRIGLTHLGKFS
jgi:hypothetical protein